MTSLWRTKEYDLAQPMHGHMNTLPPSTMNFAPMDLPKAMSEMKTVEVNGTRFYTLDDKFFPSITTVLKATDDEGRKALEKWRKKVGYEKAAVITAAAVTRGVNWHKFCELYMAGVTPGWQYVTTPENRRKAIQIALMLNENIKTVLASEASVVSMAYGVAGRLDLCAELTNGHLAVIDFKSGTRQKKKNRLNQAALQGAFYSDALTEFLPFGIIDTVVVAQICSYKLYWQTTPVKEWRETLREKIAKYAELVNKELAK